MTGEPRKPVPGNLAGEQPIVIGRARGGGPVRARSPLQWNRSHTVPRELLEVIGFVPVRSRTTTLLVIPGHVTDGEQRRRAATAAATLRLIGLSVYLDRRLEDPDAAADLSVPLLGVDLRDRLIQAGSTAHSDEVARMLLDVSAPVSGILAVAADALLAAESWWWGAEHPVDHLPTSQRLAELADQLRDIAGEVTRLRAELALLDRRRDINSTPPRRTTDHAAHRPSRRTR